MYAKNFSHLKIIYLINMQNEWYHDIQYYSYPIIIMTHMLNANDK